VLAVSAAAPLSGGNPAAAAPVPDSCVAPVMLENGGFELPPDPGIQMKHEDDVPGWKTTASDKAIEIWGPAAGVPAGSGDQFAEINANEVASLYQDVATTPGQVLKWELQHRGRSGIDVMRVSIGPWDGALVLQGPDLADSTVWGAHSGLYTVPAGQTITRLSFESIAVSGGSGGYGNFLDSVVLGNAACVITTKTVTNLSRGGADAIPGDLLEYTIASDNQGGYPATDAELVDTLPVGTTYVPGSLTIEAAAVTDAPGDDAGEVVAGVVTGRIGDGADAVTGGSIPAGEIRTVSYRVTVDSGTAGQTLTNGATLSYTESMTGDPATASDSVSTPVLPTADLEVVQTLDTTLTNRGPATYTITVSNHGPEQSPGTELTATLPLTGMTTTDTDCTVTLLQLVCDFGTMANSASRAVTVTGTVPSTAPGGTVFTLASAVTGSGFDPDPTNNSDNNADPLPDAAGLSITMTIANTTAGAPSGTAYVGHQLQARYVVTNTGNGDLTNLTVTDPFFGPVTCTPTTFALGATSTCTADALYTVTAADVATGRVNTVATAQADSPILGPAAAAATASAAITATTPAAIALTGVSPAGGLLAAGVLLTLGLGAMALGRRRLAHA